jgi:hypothetical protein
MTEGVSPANLKKIPVLNLFILITLSICNNQSLILTKQWLNNIAPGYKEAVHSDDSGKRMLDIAGKKM